MASRPGRRIDFVQIDNQMAQPSIHQPVQAKGTLRFSANEGYEFTVDDLVEQGQIGAGQYGVVHKMVHRQSGKLLAVKRIRSTMDHRDHRELLVADRSGDLTDGPDGRCPFIIPFYGTLFSEGDCWVCMELMDCSFDKFYEFVYSNPTEFIPEPIIAQIAYAMVMALNYLKQLKIIHRDVKPPNMLLNRNGDIKLCDFGICGRLVDSIATSRDAGCNLYMAPERIDIEMATQFNGKFDVRADIWALGISLFEIATGTYPFPELSNPFDQMKLVIEGPAPRLEAIPNRRSAEMVDFVNSCLTKNVFERPKYQELLDTPFLLRACAEHDGALLAAYFTEHLNAMGISPLP